MSAAIINFGYFHLALNHPTKDNEIIFYDYTSTYIFGGGNKVDHTLPIPKLEVIIYLAGFSTHEHAPIKDNIEVLLSVTRSKKFLIYVVNYP